MAQWLRHYCTNQQVTGSIPDGLIYIKSTNVMQLGSMFICNCNIALHVLDAFCVHLQERLETVVAASGE